MYFNELNDRPNTQTTRHIQTNTTDKTSYTQIVSLNGVKKGGTASERRQNEQ